MKENVHVTPVLRIKILEGSVLIHAPGDTKSRTVLQPSETWLEATDHPHLMGWIVLPSHKAHGLPLERWNTLWDDLKVEVEAKNADGSWSNLFE